MVKVYVGDIIRPLSLYFGAFQIRNLQSDIACNNLIFVKESLKFARLNDLGLLFCFVFMSSS